MPSETTLSCLLNVFFLKPEEEELGVSAPLKAALKFLILVRGWIFGRIKPLQSVDSLTFRGVLASKRSRSAFQVDDLERPKIIIY